METITLTSIFSKSEKNLKEELSKFSLPRDYGEIQRTINAHVVALFSGDNEFKNSLNASDAQFLNASLRMALSFQKLSLSDFIDYKKLSTKQEVEVDNEDKTNNVVDSTLSLLPTVICAFINPWLALAVGGGTVFVKKYVQGSEGKKKAVYVKERNVDVSHPISSSQIDTIVAGIYNICNDIDGIVSKIQRDRNDLISQFESQLSDGTLHKKYPQILNSIQYLFNQNHTSETKNSHIENLIFTVEGYGYKFITYSDDTSAFFSKRVNPNVTQPTMYLPAITIDLEDGTPEVVAEGVVFIPATQSL